jgi:hypothetical protein
MIGAEEAKVLREVVGLIGTKVTPVPLRGRLEPLMGVGWRLL